jgi:predicted nucleotidyltransferase
LPSIRLRDRDAIVTREGLIFRVLGYSHPSNIYICDVEYAPAEHFRSDNPKALRMKNDHAFYKFYEDEGWKFLRHSFPRYLIFDEMLQKKIIGVNQVDFMNVMKPDQELQRLAKTKPKDELIASLQNALGLLTERSGLMNKDFGVFGSILCGFHHPRFSDLDFVVYGRNNVAKLRETMLTLYSDSASLFRNEFGSDEPIKGKRWRFNNFSLKEFVWHQCRKLIYSQFRDEKAKRIIKTELEPVKEWQEISNEYDPRAKIAQKGWVKMYASITGDDDAPFMPSIYEIRPMKILEGSRRASEATRIVSHMEEFRMQVCRGETVYVEGNLEEIETSYRNSVQVSLTYCPRYYEQVLKVSPRDQVTPKSKNLMAYSPTRA